MQVNTKTQKRHYERKSVLDVATEICEAYTAIQESEQTQNT